MPEFAESRAKRKRLKVIFSDGTTICYKNATTTYVEAIKKIGPEVFASAGLEIGYLPVVSTECYERYKKYMMPLTDGWWVNTQSDSSQKYLQLRSVKAKLGLDYDVQLAEDFDEYDVPVEKKPRIQDSICAVFDDTDYIFEKHNEDVFAKTVEKIGAERIMQRCIEYQGKEIVTRYNKYPKQKKLDCGLWVTIPNMTKDMKRAIDYIGAKFQIQVRAVSYSEHMEKLKKIISLYGPAED